MLGKLGKRVIEPENGITKKRFITIIQIFAASYTNNFCRSTVVNFCF